MIKYGKLKKEIKKINALKKEVTMGRIGEFEKTIVAEPLNEPLPEEKSPKKVSEEPLQEPERQPQEVSP